MKPVVKQAASVEARPVERGRRPSSRCSSVRRTGPPLHPPQVHPPARGRIPKHRHPTLEHEQYVLSGRMKVTLGDEVREVAAGQAVFIPAGTPTPT